jgi:hypothetical protein
MGWRKLGVDSSGLWCRFGGVSIEGLGVTLNMQTFLPYPEFPKSLVTLDNRRLGKQRVEGLQLLMGQWKYHPASRMWRGYEGALATYVRECCLTWIYRGYGDNVLNRVNQLVADHPEWDVLQMPPWIGEPEFHRAHRSNLLRKDQTHYKRFFEPELPDNLPYIWPKP